MSGRVSVLRAARSVCRRGAGPALPPAAAAPPSPVRWQQQLSAVFEDHAVVRLGRHGPACNRQDSRGLVRAGRHVESRKPAP